MKRISIVLLLVVSCSDDHLPWRSPWGLLLKTHDAPLAPSGSREPALVQINAPLAMIQVAVESQIALLTRLHELGLIGMTLKLPNPSCSDDRD